MNKDHLLAIPGVFEVVENANEWIIKIESEEVGSNVFDYAKTLTNIKRFDVEEATLQVQVSQPASMDARVILCRRR